jgi:hypothetical protein
MVTIDFNYAKKAFETMIDIFSKDITYTHCAKTTSNVTGDETLTPGVSSTIRGALFKTKDWWVQDKIGLITEAENLAIFKMSVTSIDKDDLLAYDGETWRVQNIHTRYYNGIAIYQVCDLFLLTSPEVTP